MLIWSLSLQLDTAAYWCSCYFILIFLILHCLYMTVTYSEFLQYSVLHKYTLLLLITVCTHSFDGSSRSDDTIFWWTDWSVGGEITHTHTPSGHPVSESHAESVHPYLSLLQINFIKQQLLKLSHTLLSAVCVQPSCFYDITRLCKISRSVSAHLSIFQVGHMSQTLPFPCNYAQ